MTTTRQRSLLGAAAVLLAALTACGPRPAVQTQPPAAASRVIEHRVAAGETLAQVADNYYGDPDAAAQVARDNGLVEPGRLAAGSVLRLRFSEDQWEQARRRASALGPYNRGVELMAAGRLAEAEEAFSLALTTAPDMASARYNMALVAGQRGRHEEAAAILAVLADERPGNTDFRFALGHALFSASRPQEAAAAFREALAIDPAHRRAAFGLARALEEAGDTAGAVAAWRRYLQLDDSSGWAAQARSHLRDLGHAD
jgi:tetratricopeptide (TPR) repeat protein